METKNIIENVFDILSDTEFKLEAEKSLAYFFEDKRLEVDLNNSHIKIFDDYTDELLFILPIIKM